MRDEQIWVTFAAAALGGRIGNDETMLRELRIRRIYRLDGGHDYVSPGDTDCPDHFLRFEIPQGCEIGEAIDILRQAADALERTAKIQADQGERRRAIEAQSTVPYINEDKS